MNEFVKNFVETSIDFIDLEDWDGLYREWYKKGNKESNSDSLYLNELSDSNGDNNPDIMNGGFSLGLNYHF